MGGPLPAHVFHKGCFMSGIEKSDVKKRAGEFLVPAIMLVCIGGYWFEAAGLSASAKAFPAALTVVMVGLIALILVSAFTRTGDVVANAEDDASKTPHKKLLLARRCFIILFPAALIFYWDWIGATLALFLYAAGVSFILRERQWLLLIVLPASMSIALVYLFKTVLYIRLPDGLWLVGN